MAPIRARHGVLLVFLVAALAGCGQRSAEHSQRQPAATSSAPRAGQQLSTAVTARPAARHHIHHRKRKPRMHPARLAASAPAATVVADQTCTSGRQGLNKVVGGKLSPADNAAAPALIARLQRLQHDQTGDPALLGAITNATTLAQQWGAVLVIGPDDKLQAERLGKRVIDAIGAVNTAANAAGLGACAIPLA